VTALDGLQSSPPCSPHMDATTASTVRSDGASGGQGLVGLRLPDVRQRCPLPTRRWPPVAEVPMGALTLLIIHFSKPLILSALL